MTSNFAIECNELSKCFTIYKNPKDRLKQAFSRNPKKYHEEFWAVKNVNLSIKKGETVGVVGGNGSGKSTLLQLICGTLTPTHGTVQTNGRISALLELGSGFNPDFTGIENIYLYGCILGLKNKDIDLALEEIISFADIGDFIYQPVKSYSSGMKVRLAFGVAINIKPEIMIIDEALSVGDERFQRKCYSKIEEIREAGTSILFVSHSANTIINLCDRALLMHRGSLICSEEPKKIVSYYQKILYTPAEKKKKSLSI